jgi:hypothetical protein
VRARPTFGFLPWPVHASRDYASPMEIGKPRRVIDVEPVSEPVPEPVTVPDRSPPAPDPEPSPREGAPAGH